MIVDRKKDFSKRHNLFYISMILIAIALNIKYIFIDFGVDSEFQITMSYRLAMGDIMFKEMWEPYQMSAFLCTFFIKIYLALFHTTTGIVLFLQVIGVIIDAAVACILYATIYRLFCCKKEAFWMAWIFFIISPKDVPIAEYTNMQMWFSILLTLALCVYFKTKRIGFLIISALCLCGTILSYFSCLTLFIGAVLLISFYGKKRDLFIFTGTCIICGILYLLFIFSGISVSEFIKTINNILLLETSHSEGIIDKCISYINDFIRIMLVFAVLYVVSYMLMRLFKVTKEVSVILRDLIFIFLVLMISLYTVIFWQDYVRYTYSISFLAIIFVGMHHANKLSADKFLFYVCGTVISILQFISTLLLTNLVLVASIPYLLIAVIAAFLPIYEAIRQSNIKGIYKAICKSILYFGLVLLIFRNIYIIRPMTGYVSSLLNIGGIVKSGPAIGILSEYMGPYIQNESMKEWKEYIDDGSSIFLVGGELDTLGYLYANTEIAAPSLVPTPGYNEYILEYWSMNPNKYPDVVIASCWYGTLNSTISENEWFMNWLEEDFKPQYYVDGKYWRYYFR